MEKPTAGTGMALRWVQPRACEGWYELRSGRQLLATLRCEAGRASVATGGSAHSYWTFKQVGCYNRHVTVREAGTEATVAVYRPRWLGDGSVQFPDGRVYCWRPSDFRATQWCFHDEGGHPLLSFQCGVEQAGLEVHRTGQARPELPLLMTLGWYLLLLRKRETSAAAAEALTVSAACAA
jgi:hypothetical protein